jgi:hypothetical protein
VSFIVDPHTNTILGILGTDTASLSNGMAFSDAMFLLNEWSTGVVYVEYEKTSIDSSGDSVTIKFVRREFERHVVFSREVPS